jgi:hypothetical protein
MLKHWGGKGRGNITWIVMKKVLKRTKLHFLDIREVMKSTFINRNNRKRM